jgi:hypothetical protein
MAERLKDKGLRDELRPFKKRVLRQAAAGNISKADTDWLVKRLNDIEARVMKMNEKPEREREFIQYDNRH